MKTYYYFIVLLNIIGNTAFMVHSMEEAGIFGAIAHNDIGYLQQLIENSVDINVQDDYGRTPLHCALEDDRVHIAGMLIAAGANINLQDKRGWTPLHLAAAASDMTRLLIDAGADVNKKNDEQKTALHLAIDDEERETIDIEVIPLLIQAGIDLDAQDNERETALHRAVYLRYLDIVSMLVTAGANLSKVDDQAKSVLQIVMDNKDSYEATEYKLAMDILGKQSLLVAVDDALDLEAAALYLDPTSKSTTRFDQLLYSIIKNDVDLKDQLMKDPSYFTEFDEHRATLLMYAAAIGNESVVQFLLSNGADIYAVDKRGRSVFDLLEQILSDFELALNKVQEKKAHAHKKQKRKIMLHKDVLLKQRACYENILLLCRSDVSKIIKPMQWSIFKKRNFRLPKDLILYMLPFLIGNYAGTFKPHG